MKIEVSPSPQQYVFSCGLPVGEAARGTRNCLELHLCFSDTLAEYPTALRSS